MTIRRATDNSNALDAFMTTKFQIDAMLERLKALSDNHFHAITLLREISDLERDDDGDVIIGADADGHNDLMLRIIALLATNDQ